MYFSKWPLAIFTLKTFPILQPQMLLKNVKPSNEYENANYKSRNSFYNFKNEKKRQAISLNVAM